MRDKEFVEKTGYQRMKNEIIKSKLKKPKLASLGAANRYSRLDVASGEDDGGSSTLL